MGWLNRMLGRRPPPPAAPPISLFPTPAILPPPRPRLPQAAASFRHLRSGRATILTAGRDQVGMDADPAPEDRLIAVFPDASRQLCFLLSPDLRPIAVRADGLRAPSISAFRLQTADAALIRLRHPLSPLRFLGVTLPGQGAPDGCVMFDSLGRTRLDQFETLPVDPTELPAAFLHAAAELCAAAAPPGRADTLIGMLRDLTLRPDLAEPLIRILPRAELPRLAAMLLDQPETLALLQEAMPDDPWMQRILPALSAWRRDRPPVEPDRTLTSPASDEFAGDPLEGHGQPQAGFALTALARTRIEPRRGACLVAAARNEGPYLLEWLAYHQAAGFEHAFLYTNDNWDGSDSLLAALAQAGAITLIHNQAGTHCGPQYKAYSHALSLLPHILDYQWAAVLDLDEYFGCNADLFGGIADYLAWQQTQPVDAVALSWQVFVGLRQDTWRDEPSRTRFTRREPHANAHVKSIFRPNLFWHAHAHFPRSTLNAPFIFRTEQGGLHHHHGEQKRLAAFAESPTAQFAWINHYFLRSAPEALWKIARGHGDWKGSVPERHLDMARFIARSFVALADKTDLVEDRRILACAPGTDARLAVLRGLPGVAAAEDRIKAGFAERLPRMVKTFVETKPPEKEPPEFPAFRQILQELGN